MILNHPTLWTLHQNDNQQLIEKIKNLEKEVSSQRALSQQLEEQIKDFERYKKEVIDKAQLLQAQIGMNNLQLQEEKQKLLEQNEHLLEDVEILKNYQKEINRKFESEIQTLNSDKIQLIDENKSLQRSNSKKKEQIEKLTQKMKNHKRSDVPLNEYQGIIYELIQRDIDFVSVQASDTYPGFPVQNILFLDSSVWFNENTRFDSYLKFHFQTKKVKPSKYLLKSAHLSSYPQGWKLEGSNDEENWEIIDQRSDQKSFTQNWQFCSFDCHSNTFYSFFKITQTQKPTYDTNWFGLSYVDFYGEIQEE
jgi:hypothetical protein